MRHARPLTVVLVSVVAPTVQALQTTPADLTVVDLNGTLEPGSASTQASPEFAGDGFAWFRLDGLKSDRLARTDGTSAGTSTFTFEPPLFVPVLALQPFSFSPGTILVPTSIGPSSSHGLWSLGGTDAEVVLLTDATIGSTVGSSFVKVGSEAWFVAGTDATGQELWSTDGTPAGTKGLLELLPGPAGFLDQGAVIESGGVVYLTSTANGVPELYRTDGTAAGTTLLMSFPIPPSGVAPLFGYDVGGRLVLFVPTGPGISELWSSDGTSAGTVKLASDIGGGLLLGVGGGRLYILDSASALPFGGPWQLVATDGSQAGTSVVSLPDPTAGEVLAVLRGAVFESGPKAGQFVFWWATAATGIEPWISDGTAAGTGLLADVEPGPAGSSGAFPSFPQVDGATVYLRADTAAEGLEVWSTDGTAAGTAVFAPLEPGAQGVLGFSNSFVLTAGGVVFPYDDGSGLGQELWVTDGTTAGSQALADLSLGATASSNPGSLRRFLSSLLLTADDGVAGREAHVSDGTVAGTLLLGDLSPATSLIGGAPEQDFTPLGSRALFGLRELSNASAPFIGELWSTDGTAAGTALVERFDDPVNAGRVPEELTRAGDRVFFLLEEPFAGPSIGSAIAVSDGTTAGTSVLASFDGVPSALTALGDSAAFAVFAGATPGLWFSDGTQAGTQRLADLDFAGGFTAELIAYDGALYFGARAASGEEGLWTSDGTAAGTKLLAAINPVEFAIPSSFGVLGDQLLFGANDGLGGFDLWRTDGTAAGTQVLAELPAAPNGGQLQELTVTGDFAFFTRVDGPSLRGLWITDGTAAGTVQVTTFPSGSKLFLTDVGLVDQVAFTVGGQPWVSDGTAVGTRPVFPDDEWFGSIQQRLGGQLALVGTEDDIGTELFFLPALGRRGMGAHDDR